MKLKSLEIIGFKSFSERTVITFEKDLTAIVGPNGCGKSNIVDAIRWVMGEQSAKHLRGKQMEDVIFSGSDKRPPLSMASVELTFSTQGYQTPVTYLNHAEISVCRRLYRSGESEYFINKTPVRLKDITDLFLGTGIGTKAYSVIEQDRINQIVLSKPEDRRFYIEEVAGISRFKSRKEAAIRKMEATGQNLLRLADLVGELERQMKTLDRQARKAERYRKLKTEFAKWDLLVSSVQYDTAAASQEKWEKELRQFDEEECRQKASLQQAENGLEAEKLEFADREREIQTLQNDLFEVTNYLRLAEADLRYKNDKRAGLVDRLKKAGNSMDEIKAGLSGVQNGLTQINDQKLSADFAEQTCCEEVEKRQAEVLNLQDRLSSLKVLSENLREKIHSTESRMGQIEAEISGKISVSHELEQKISADGKELEKLDLRTDQVRKIHEEMDLSLESLRQLNLDLASKTAELSDDLMEHRKNLEWEERELASLKDELTLRKSRLASLVELQKNFEGYHEGTRSVLLKKRDLGEAGIYGTVADFIETDSRYEGAVSAVLGEKLHYVVVKSQEDGVSAVDYLKTASAGRTSFIPVELRSTPSASGEITEKDGVVGPLKNFVSLKGDYKNLAEFLFGDVTLVENLSKALDIWSSNGHRKTLVTLAGEVVDPAGVITGGSLSDTSKALLEKKRETAELNLLVARLEGELKSKESVRKAMADRVEALACSLEAVKKTSFEEVVKIAGQERDVSHIKKELESIEARKKELAGGTNLLKQQLESTGPEIAELDREKGELERELACDRNSFSQASSEADSFQALFEEANSGLTQLKIDLAREHERNRHFESEMERLEGEALKLKMELCRQEIGAETAEHGMAFLEKYTAHINRMLEKMLKKKEGLDLWLRSCRENCENEMRRIREKEASIREMRLLAEQAAQRLNRLTVSLTEIRGTMKHLSGQVFERHHLDLKTVYKDHLGASVDLESAIEKAAHLKDELSKMGEVNTAAFEEYEDLKNRFEFLSRQKTDLESSLESLKKVIQKINRTTREKFLATFGLINEKFEVLFPELFQGGRAKLVLTDENNLLETGVEIIAQPPGKKLQSISLLSGGEKALTAVSLVFAIFQIKPSPFCVLDEVDAPLDDVNVGRYNEVIRQMIGKTQFVVITHNKKTMEMVDVLYGVTMQEPGTSQIVSVELHK